MKKFQKIFRNKLFLGVVVVIIILAAGGGVYVASNNFKKSASSQTESKSDDKPAATEGKVPAKTDNAPKDDKAGQTTGQPTPVVNTAVADLREVSLTVYLNKEATTSADGKTTIPAGSISPFFYLPSGLYSAQKASGNSWVDVATSINYPGHGGLPVAAIGPAEDNVSFRVLKIENGRVIAISKIFVVKRADLSGGTTTYN